MGRRSDGKHREERRSCQELLCSSVCHVHLAK
jgi:hypothetical protein